MVAEPLRRRPLHSDRRGSDGEIHRLYRREWVIVATFGRDSVPAEESAEDAASAHLALCQEAQAHFQERYAGRVHDKDFHCFVSGNGPRARVELKLRLPNLKGEFKFVFLAQRHAENQGWADYTIVVRNSRADHELRSYGTKKLPAT